MPRSMTSFARHEVQYPWGTVSCEMRSVNHRYLEPSIRLPESLRNIEPAMREALRKQLSRGKVELSICLHTDISEDALLGLNETLAARITSMAEHLQSHISSPAKLNALDILKWPGVIKTAEIDSDELQTAALSLLDHTLKTLIQSREREGAELMQFISQRLDGVAEHVAKVRQRLPEVLDHYQQKLRAKLDALKVEVDEERYGQEAIYIAQKADVAEELDRLESHINEVRNTLKQKGPMGRRLDFLMQELNREANTLSSKSMASDTTLSAVDLKVLIEQMREQVQNIE
ncbi:MAG: hypothetical protein ACI9Y1_001550 [Lentisphaeria bacterium]|jgi:uncharacterized protein (TIGR00255 family)